MPSSVAVERIGGRHVARLVSGPLRPQLLRTDERACRVGLLATNALLLGGDDVTLEVSVGEGATLDLRDIAGTVAYHGRGAPAGWHVRVRLGAGAHLRYSGEPFVVSDGADVARTLELEVAAQASAVLRETLVLGRSGQTGGRLRSRTVVRYDGRDVLREDQELDPTTRTEAGMLGPHRVVDSVLRVGVERAEPSTATAYALVGGAGTLVRWLGSSLAASPLHTEWARVVAPPALALPAASTAVG